MRPRDDEWVDVEFTSGDCYKLLVWTGSKYETVAEGPWDDDAQRAVGAIRKGFESCMKEFKPVTMTMKKLGSFRRITHVAGAWDNKTQQCRRCRIVLAEEGMGRFAEGGYVEEIGRENGIRVWNVVTEYDLVKNGPFCEIQKS